MPHDPTCRNNACKGCGTECDRERLEVAKKLLQRFVRACGNDPSNDALIAEALKFPGVRR